MASEEDLWMRIAFATRYGHIPWSEAMAIPWRRLKPYLKALARIVREEAKAIKQR